MRRRHHVAAAVGLLVGQACSHGHPAAVPAKRSAPETLPALDTATYPDVVPETTTTTTTTEPEIVTTTVEPAQPRSPKEPAVMTAEPAPMGERTVRGACGGSLPPCYVMEQESGGSLTAVNPSSGAAGKWQFLPSTSRSLGYSQPMNEYDEATQDEAARKLYALVGCSAWDC